MQNFTYSLNSLLRYNEQIGALLVDNFFFDTVFPIRQSFLRMGFSSPGNFFLATITIAADGAAQPRWDIAYGFLSLGIRNLFYTLWINKISAQVVEVNDDWIEVDAFKTTLRFIYSAYKNVELTGESALAVLYIGKHWLEFVG